MFPVHQFDLHPHQRNEMQSAPQHCPSSEAIPPQMRPNRDTFYYQSWPYSSNFAYVHPAQFHGCCQHIHFPGSCGFGSPYFQPSPHYFQGNYPVPPGAYPIHYIPPAPQHIMELPHYEYDKNMGRYSHCCGCLNNPCNGNNGRYVKIEEADPHPESKADQSLVPFKPKNYSDPVVWYLPGDSKIQVGGKTNDQLYGKQEDSPHNSKSQYPCPILWFPSDVNKVNDKPCETMREKQEGEFCNAKTNYPYPILWFPPAYISKDGVSNEPEKQNGYFNGLKTPERSKSSDQQQNFSNGWFPFSTNKLSPWKTGSPGEERQQHDANKPGFACPLFWMPYKTDVKENEDIKKSGVDQECAQKAPPCSEVLPEMVPATKEEDNSERKDKNISGGSTEEIVKSNKVKTIPVKQAEPIEGEKMGECARSSEIPVNCSEAGKLSKDGGEKKSPSPTKSSKLPPVCLRVDPMPRKRTGNGSSRSPSPPGDKGKSNKVSRDDPKPDASMDAKQIPESSLPFGGVAASDKEKEQDKSKSGTVHKSEGTGSEAGNCEPSNSAPDVVLANHTSDEPAADLSVDDKGKTNKVSGEDLKVGTLMDAKQTPRPSISHGDIAASTEGKEQHKSMLRTIQVSEGTDSEDRNCELSNNAPDVILANQTNDKPAFDLSATDVKWKGVVGEGAEQDKCCWTAENEETSNADEKHVIVAEEPKRITLSEAEAARIIQSAYRGYAVRRWEPLIKLKQVKEVKMKVGELKSSIQAFESSPDIQGFEKWRTVIGETIMSLLLKLDTIQGLHPSIRDFRRSVAKELVGLQEKVDHITQKKAEIVSLQDSPMKAVDSEADLCNKKGQEEEKQGQEDKETRKELVSEFRHEGACQADDNHTPQGYRNTPHGPMTEATTIETESHHDDLDTVSDFIIPDVSEISLEPVLKACSEKTELENDNPASGGISHLRENEVSEVKGLEKFPKGEINEFISMADNLTQNEPIQESVSENVVLNNLPGILEEYSDIKDPYLEKDNQRADEVLAESCIEPELAELPHIVLDDNCESNVHLQIEEEEKEHKTDLEQGDVNGEAADGGVCDTNSVASRQEKALEVPVTLGAIESSRSAGQKHNSDELRKTMDDASEDIFLDLVEEEASFKAVDVAKTEHREERMEFSAEVLNDKSGVNGCFTVESEMPAVTPMDTTETCEEEQGQLSFSESGGVNVSAGEENRFPDSRVSSNKDEIQECDSPKNLSKSCDVEHEKTQLKDKIELQASGVAGGNGIDTMFTEKCSCAASDEEPLDQGEYNSLEAKQELPPPSPTGSDMSLFSEGDRKLIEENMKLRETMQKLIEAGQDQLAAIANLSSRVKELEKRISKKKKLKLRRHGGPSSCWRYSSNDKVNAVAMAT